MAELFPLMSSCSRKICPGLLKSRSRRRSIRSNGGWWNIGPPETKAIPRYCCSMGSGPVRQDTVPNSPGYPEIFM